MASLSAVPRGDPPAQREVANGSQGKNTLSEADGRSKRQTLRFELSDVAPPEADISGNPGVSKALALPPATASSPGDAPPKVRCCGLAGGGRWTRARFAHTFTYFRLHLACFSLMGLIGGLILFGIEKGEVAFIDTLFLAFSSVCVTGLSTANVATLTRASQAVMFVLAVIGGNVVWSVVPVIIRRVYFARTMRQELSHLGISPKETDRLLENEVEYRALGWILRIALAHILFWPIATIICWGLYFTYNQAAAEVLLTANPGNIPAWWFATFQSYMSFNNAGFSLFSANLMPLANNYYFLLSTSMLILFGNTAYPIVVYSSVYLLHKWYGPREPAFAFLLARPRKCFTHLFNGFSTKILLALIVVTTFVEFIAFLALDFNQPFLASFSPAVRLLVGWFQSVSTRTAGFNVVDLAEVAPAMQLIYSFFMYMSAYPFALTVRKSADMDVAAQAVHLEDLLSPAPHNHQLEGQQANEQQGQPEGQQADVGTSVAQAPGSDAAGSSADGTPAEATQQPQPLPPSLPVATQLTSSYAAGVRRRSSHASATLTASALAAATESTRRRSSVFNNAASKDDATGASAATTAIASAAEEGRLGQQSGEPALEGGNSAEGGDDDDDDEEVDEATLRLALAISAAQRASGMGEASNATIGRRLSHNYGTIGRRGSISTSGLRTRTSVTGGVPGAFPLAPANPSAVIGASALRSARSAREHPFSPSKQLQQQQSSSSVLSSPSKASKSHPIAELKQQQHQSPANAYSQAHAHGHAHVPPLHLETVVEASPLGSAPSTAAGPTSAVDTSASFAKPAERPAAAEDGPAASTSSAPGTAPNSATKAASRHSRASKASQGEDNGDEGDNFDRRFPSYYDEPLEDSDDEGVFEGGGVAHLYPADGRDPLEGTGLLRDEAASATMMAAPPPPVQSLRREAGRMLSGEIFLLFVALLLICIAESETIRDTLEPTYLNIFSIIFELTSAFGTVGLSIGFPGSPCSLSAQFGVFSKLVMIVVMLAGRHRGLPNSIDPAVYLPALLSTKGTDEEIEVENEAATSGSKSRPTVDEALSQLSVRLFGGGAPSAQLQAALAATAPGGGVTVGTGTTGAGPRSLPGLMTTGAGASVSGPGGGKRGSVPLRSLFVAPPGYVTMTASLQRPWVQSPPQPMTPTRGMMTATTSTSAVTSAGNKAAVASSARSMATGGAGGTGGGNMSARGGLRDVIVIIDGHTASAVVAAGGSLPGSRNQTPSKGSSSSSGSHSRGLVLTTANTATANALSRGSSKTSAPPSPSSSSSSSSAAAAGPISPLSAKRSLYQSAVAAAVTATASRRFDFSGAGTSEGPKSPLNPAFASTLSLSSPPLASAPAPSSGASGTSSFPMPLAAPAVPIVIPQLQLEPASADAASVPSPVAVATADLPKAGAVKPEPVAGPESYLSEGGFAAPAATAEAGQQQQQQ